MPRKSRVSPARRRKAAERIHSAAIRLLRLVRVRDASSGVGPARLSALSVLVFAGPRSLGELAAIEQVKPPTMSRVVDALVSDGYVARESGEDRRSVVLSATSRGRRLLDRARQRRIDELTGRLGALQPEEIETLLRAADLLQRIAS